MKKKRKKLCIRGSTKKNKKWWINMKLVFIVKFKRKKMCCIISCLPYCDSKNSSLDGMEKRKYPRDGWNKKIKYSKKEIQNVWHDGQKLLKNKKTKSLLWKNKQLYFVTNIKNKQKTNKKMYYYPLLMNPDVLATTDTESRQ